MRFEEALQAMREGKKVRRECWETRSFYTLANGVGIFDRFGKRVIMIEDDDILAKDWEVVNE